MSERRCQTFWTGGHLCLREVYHSLGHCCASESCPTPEMSSACWGEDAGMARHGQPPAALLSRTELFARPWRALYNNGPRTLQ
jgi:hypothetical protein